MNNFSEWLVAQLKAKRFTQGEIADVTGVSQSTVHRWADGKKLPEAGELFKLATYLGTSMDVLFNNSVPPSSPMALHDSPPGHAVDDLLHELQNLKEQLATVERAAKRLKK